MAGQVKDFVYVISGRYQKIGHSRSPRGRLDQFKTASPYKIEITFEVECVQAQRVERKAHAMLADHRLNGEWFDVTKEVAVETVKAALAAVEQENETVRLLAKAEPNAVVVPLAGVSRAEFERVRTQFQHALYLLQHTQWTVARHYDEMRELVLPGELEGQILDMLRAHNCEVWASPNPVVYEAFDDGWAPQVDVSKESAK